MTESWVDHAGWKQLPPAWRNDRTAADERALIVAWLRARQRRRRGDALAVAFRNAIDAIERGEHTKGEELP